MKRRGESRSHHPSECRSPVGYKPLSLGVGSWEWGVDIRFNYPRALLNTAGSILLSTRNKLAIARNGSVPAPKNTGVQP